MPGEHGEQLLPENSDALVKAPVLPIFPSSHHQANAASDATLVLTSWCMKEHVKMALTFCHTTGHKQVVKQPPEQSVHGMPDHQLHISIQRPGTGL